jgi:GNAT superfamily N-acetyltransferase
MTEDQKEIYQKWKDNVNMSKSELQKFYDSEDGKKAGLSKSEASKQGIDYGRESARWIFKMKDTPVSEWTDSMWRWAKKQNSFISRMSGVKGRLYNEKGEKTRKHLSLLIWGHNPEKKSKGGKITKEAEKLQKQSETITQFEPEGFEGAFMKRGGRIVAQTPAPKKDRIFGSKINKKGSAKSKSSGKDIKFSEEVIEKLKNKVSEYNSKHKNKVSLATLKAVYRRGLGAYSTSHRPTISGGKPNSRNAWSIARVNKFLEKKAGKPVKKAYVQDDDLLKNGGELRYAEGEIENLIKQGVIELNFYSATPEHAEERGIIAKKPLYIQNLCVSESMRLKGIGKKVLTYLEDYATKNGYDVIFGYCDVDMVKNWLYRKGYAINDLTNEFYKIIKLADVNNTTFDANNPDIRYAEGGLIEDKYGNLIAYQSGNYRISIDNPNNTKRVVLWNKNDEKWHKIGQLNTYVVEMRIDKDIEFKKYLKVQEIEIDKKHRGLGLGMIMYKTLIKYAGKDIKGIISYLPNRANKLQIPKIYRKLGAKEVDDYAIIKLADVNNTTFDPENPDIRYEVGGNTTDSKIALPDVYSSPENLQRVLNQQGYELTKKETKSQQMEQSLSISEVADIHGVSVENLRNELVEGIKTEMEHTNDPEQAKKIALDHLKENPQYYQYLQKMEAKMKADTIDSHFRDLEMKYNNGGTIEPVYKLKTPTGEPSRLNYIQQVLVRTTQFKNWFGDWETASRLFIADNRSNFDKHFEGVSKVLDMVTLEPQAVYHGTRVNEEFFEFDVSMEEGIGRPYGYFADNQEYSANFVTGSSNRGQHSGTGFLYSCFLNIKKPFYAINEQFYGVRKPIWHFLRNISSQIMLDRYGYTVNMNPFDVENETPEAKGIFLDITIEVTDQIAEYGELTAWRGSGYSELPFWTLMSSDKKSIFKRFLMREKYDGIRYAEEFSGDYDIDNPAEFTKAWCIFNSGQVKLADGRNIDFDPLKVDIRMADGGKTTAPVEPENKQMPLSRTQRMKMNMGLEGTQQFGDGGSVYGDKKHSTDAKDGGYFVGNSHAKGGIKAVNKDTGQIIEVEGNEVIINKRSVSDNTKREFEGEMLTNRQILSKINEMGGGVKFEAGGNTSEHCACSGKKYKFGGETLEDYVILSRLNAMSETVLSPTEQAVKYVDDLTSKIYGI